MTEPFREYHGSVDDLLTLSSRITHLRSAAGDLQALGYEPQSLPLLAEAAALAASSFRVDSLLCLLCRQPYLVIDHIGDWIGLVPTNGICGPCLARVDAEAGLAGKAKPVPGGMIIVEGRGRSR